MSLVAVAVVLVVLAAPLSGEAQPGRTAQPATVGLAINLRTAKVLGLTIPSSLLLRADELVE